jgi:hypothetical protein
MYTQIRERRWSRCRPMGLSPCSRWCAVCDLLSAHAIHFHCNTALPPTPAFTRASMASTLRFFVCACLRAPAAGVPPRSLEDIPFSLARLVNDFDQSMSFQALLLHLHMTSNLGSATPSLDRATSCTQLPSTGLQPFLQNRGTGSCAGDLMPAGRHVSCWGPVRAGVGAIFEWGGLPAYAPLRPDGMPLPAYLKDEWLPLGSSLWGPPSPTVYGWEPRSPPRVHCGEGWHRRAERAQHGSGEHGACKGGACRRAREGAPHSIE